ncbi:uncharacterized protein F5147DRAFT_771670 [Suillus discolor]|uniref:C3H1-type domain-containing protein n=1 Tax=Suillus discolor TaxID=1912936 RepID=A0A9P7FB80_9AGAM|nr:uncharacterized protein F5147DRAFT_771670 [Suillus discolor]KAG2111519.1 hypothetical protein F5147DRAFT_771670 [Suillus discolor]
MSLYKTMRCRTRPSVCPLCSQYFDEHGKGIKPFCNQGSRCRFIHPSDLQWDKGRVNPEKSAYNDTKCEKSKTKPKHKPKASSTSPLQRGPRSSPLVPQSDLFRRNHGELDRERGRDREVKPIQRDRRDRDFDSWERYVRDRDRSRDVRRSSRERADEERALHSSKRSKRTEGHAIRSSVMDSGDNPESGSRHGKDRLDASQMTPGNLSFQSRDDNKRSIDVISEFSSRLARLCSQLVQDSCQLDKEEDKLKAFTELSTELSKAAPSTAMAVTPALAAVITSHAKSKERVATRVRELDSLWESLLSNIVTTIVKTTDINLERAIALLHTETDVALQHGTNPGGSWTKLSELKNTSADDDRENGAAGAEHGSKAWSRSPDSKRRRVESSTPTAIPVKEENVDYRGLLAAMKSSLAMQTRTFELLAKEKQLVGGVIDIATIVDNLMNTDDTNSPASTDSDAVNCSTARVYFGPVQSPEKRLIASEVTRRRELSIGTVDSLLRPSGLPTLHAPPSPQEITRAPDESVERSDEDADEISDVAAHLSREDTPENDTLGQNEPSSVLASRIMRACDNPSPPPRAHPTLYFGLVMRDGRTPFPDISAPPSPFRPINLRERLSQFSPTERALSQEPPQHQVSYDQNSPPHDSAGNIFQPDLISFESCSALVKTAESSAEGRPCGSPIQTLSSSVDDLLSHSPEHPSVIPAPRVDGIERSNSSDSLNKLPQGCPPAGMESRPPHSSFPSPLVATSSAPDVTEEHARLPVRRSARLSGTPRPNQTTHTQQPPETPKLKGKSKATTTAPEGNVPLMRDEQTKIKRDDDSRRRALNGKYDTTPNFQRELGSLSPQSADVLTRLLPSERSTPLPEGQYSLPQREISSVSLDPPLLTPQRPKSDSQHPLATVQRSLVVAPTPIRPNGNLFGSSSHLKFSLTVEDASRTPARRVPIQDAIVQGSASSQNTMLLSAKRDTSTRLVGMRGPVFSRPALDDPSRSPAKRILITDFNSPVRSPTRPAGARARSASAEPKPIVSQPIRSHSVDPLPRAADNKGKEPMFPNFSSKPRSGAKLPFPLKDLKLVGEDLIANQAASSSSPVKFSLKQPSIGSRIPRIGAKPYARPQPKKPVTSTAAKLPAFGTGPRVPLFKSAPAGNGSSSSEESSAIAPPLNRKFDGKSVAEPSVLSTLKRKRGIEETATSSPTHHVMVRQIVPGMLGSKYAPKAAPGLPPSAPSLPEPSPRKPPGPIKFRKVEPGVISARYAAPIKTTASDPPATDVHKSSPQILIVSEEPVTQSSSPPSSTSPSALPEPELAKPSHDVVEPKETVEASAHQPPANRGRGRRTPRRKPAAQHANDVFGPSTSTQPLQLRRSRRSEGEGFMGMSAVALQALTTSNTTKNQEIFAKLEREVIRKDGTRPESPAIKVRTISQKQRDMRDRQRLERAERRAKRGEDGPGLSDCEGASELGDQSILGFDKEHDENDGVIWTKHRRGPGEVEDYETPVRPDRPVKRLRFGEGPQQEGERESKRVKWHQGLSTEIYLDEVHPRPHSWTKDFVIEKSCLAPTSKASGLRDFCTTFLLTFLQTLRLDTLGNVMDVEQHPLTDLHPENIVVKKFVYDNDAEVVVKEVIPPKITRSKSKKSKS